MDPAFDPSSDWSRRHAAALAKVSGLVERQLSPLGLRTIDTLQPEAGDVVLDVGCGAGQTLPQLAQRVGLSGRVIGVDIADALLTIARDRCRDTSAVDLLKDDAQTMQLRDASLDGVFSRFGVMGFSDPPQAFKNLRRMLRPGGRLAFCCWRTLEENELDHFPVWAAGLEDNVRPGPFSFADPDHVRDFLATAGFSAVTVQPCDEPVSCGGVDETVEVLLSVGALGQIVRQRSSLRQGAEYRLRKALMALGSPERVDLSAAVWIVSAQVVDLQGGFK